MQNWNKEAEAFSKTFRNFIKPYLCQFHKKQPTFVCIDANCRQKGLICSSCLTIKSSHKNHDTIQITEFMKHCLKAFSKDFKKNEITQMARKVNELNQEFLKLMSDFHQSYSNMLKAYISKRSEMHKQKQAFLFPENSLAQLKNCRFKSIGEMNKTLNILISRMSSKLEVDTNSQEKFAKKIQLYIDDLEYETSFLGRELQSIQTRLKELLTAKSSSPLILAPNPTFNNPRFFQDGTLVYLGETKNNRPHGKGMCFFKETQKIAFGYMQGGKLEGPGQLYFATGDYYLGDFHNDKKEGRGSYQWTGKEDNAYQGEFKNGKRNGRGTFWWSDGSWYEGEFQEGVQKGFGCLFREENRKEYEGYWLDGMFDGKGVQYFQNGERYEGSFKSDKFNGEGIFFKEDSVIHGIWKDNELSVVNMVKSILPDSSHN